jgi:iron complex outermembrane recepter protein
LSQQIKPNSKRQTAQRIAKGVGTTAVLTLVAAINTAYAQEAAKQDTVVVTGIRKGIEDAISVKKDSDNIVEAISAEDIGKLPDNSIAESIARLPGVTAQRVLGRAQTISIRGMSGDFSGTLLNGREQVSTGDNRNVEFDQYPSELLTGVLIYKTPDASLIGQGLSGTVDMQLARPLNFGSRVIALNGRLEKNSLGKLNPDVSDIGNRFTATYIDQFANRTFGVALGFSHLDLKTQQQKWQTWGYPDDARTLGGAEAKVFSGQSKRDSLFGTLEWKPNKSYTGVLDLYYSKFDETVVDRGLVTGLAWSGAAASNITTQNGLVTGGTYTWPNANSGNKPVVWNELQTRNDEVSSIGLNNKFDLGGGWKAVADISSQKAKRKERILEAYAGTNAIGDTYSYTIDPNSGIANANVGINYADPTRISLIDTAGWGQDGYVKYLNVKDDLNNFKGTVSKEVGYIFSTVDFGLNYADRKKSKDVPESLLYLKSSPTTVPSSLLVSPASLNGVGLNTSVLSWNIDGAANQLYNFVTKTHPDIYNKQWKVAEKVTTAFLKGNIDSEWGSIPVRGNLGVQLIHTDQKGTGESVYTGGNICSAGPGGSQVCPDVTTTFGKTYNDYLPSLNLAMSLPYDQTVRFAAGKQLARARMDQMKGSVSISFDQAKNYYTGSYGNPLLDPYRATALDVSYEKYFGKKAYVSAAAFYKDLKTYIYNADAPLPGTYNDGTHGSAIAVVNGPQNGEGGKISGIEFSISLPFNLVSSTLDGFGFIGSFSDTHSEIHPFGPSSSTPLPGLSKQVINLTAYYEKNGFQARISERYRSPYLGEIQGFGADRDYVYIDKERVRDMQIGYEFQTGAMKGLGVTFQVNNLSNTPYRTYFADKPGDPTKEYSKFGRTYLLGVNYKM